ncbi:MAG: hypothetical protein EOO40_11745, partial [Deltaproteobacteria bacterium]
ADASTIHYNHQTEEPMHLRWETRAPATRALVTITDAREMPVRVMTVDAKDGQVGQCFWDGKDQNGKELVDGDYHVRVAVQLKNNQIQEAAPRLFGRAGGIGFDDNGAGVMVGNARVRPQEMREVEMQPLPPIPPLPGVKEPTAQAASKAAAEEAQEVTKEATAQQLRHNPQ